MRLMPVALIGALSLGFASGPSPAQAEDRVLFSGGSGQVHYSAANLNAFSHSFRQVEGLALDQGFGPFGTATGPRFDVGYARRSERGFTYISTLGFADYDESALARYDDGAWRELEVELKDVTLGFEVGLVQERFYFTFLGELKHRDVELLSIMRRADGTPTTTDPLVGRYETQISSIASVGASLGFGKDPVFLVLRWTTDVSYVPGGYLMDASPYKGEEGTTLFPMDYEAFGQGTTPGGFNGVYGADFVGQTLSLSVVILAPVE